MTADEGPVIDTKRAAASPPMSSLSEQISPEMIYRIILDYEALKDGFADRIDDLNAPLTEIDAAAGMTRGNMQKLLCRSGAQWAREFGWESLGKTLRGTGLALALIIDDERFAPIKARMDQRVRPKRPIARSARPRWLITKSKSLKMNKKRWDSTPPEKRKKMAQKLGRASAAARRRARRERERDGV